MNLSGIVPTAFISPHGQNREEIEELFREVLDLLLRHAATAGKASPLPETGSYSGLAEIPANPVKFTNLLAKLQLILSGSMNAASPGYIGHLDTMPATASIVGDFLAAAVNNNMLSLEMSPVLSQIENALLKQIAQVFGFDEKAGGVMVSGGSLANLEALAVARNFAFESLEKGVVSLDKQPVLFASEAAHTSINKAAMLLGLGTAAVVSVKTNADSQMDVSALESAIEQAKAEGKAPFCVVATAGTTTTGNIDTLPQIARIAEKYNLWFHVDAAYGGALAFTDSERHRLKGIEYADSVTFNPQKWMYVAKTCAMVLFKDASLLEKHFRVSAPYMRGNDEFTNIGEISVQGTHHADVLKLWLSFQHIGRKGFEQLINESYSLTAHLINEIEKRPFLQMASKPEMNIVCFRGAPDWLDENEWDDWNARLQNYLLREGNVFLSLPLYRGSRWLRAVLLNPFSNEKTIDAMFDYVDKFANSSQFKFEEFTSK